MAENTKYQKLLIENNQLTARLEEAEETLRAIRQGEIDALVVKGAGGNRIYTLKGAEHTYRVIIESMNEGAVTTDTKGTIVYGNSSFAQMAATPLEKVIGELINTFIHPTDLKKFESFLKSSTQKKNSKMEVRLVTRAKRTIPVLFSLTSLKLDKDQDGMSVIITDLSEQKRNEEVVALERLSAQKLIHEQEVRSRVEKLLDELKEEKKRLQQEVEKRKELERQKDEFISIASHELKTPVTTIKSYTQILQRSLKEEVKPSLYLSKMDSQVDRLTALITELLDVSKIQAGKLRLQKERFLLSELVKDLAEDSQYADNSHRIIVSSSSPVAVVADKYRISQVLINLISNAIKYSPQAKEIVVSLKSTSENAIVSVKDFGIGISKQDQKKVFDRFFQAKSKIRQSYSGLGLGLYISSEIISQHKGSMWVESKRRVGTTFSFSLPLKDN